MREKWLIPVVALLAIVAVWYTGGDFLNPGATTPLSDDQLASVFGGDSYCYVPGMQPCNQALLGCANQPGDCRNSPNGPICFLAQGYLTIGPMNYDYAQISTTMNGSKGVVNGKPFSCYEIDDCSFNMPCILVNGNYVCVDLGPIGFSPPVTPRTPDNNPCQIGS